MCFLLIYYLLISFICLWAGLLCYAVIDDRFGHEQFRTRSGLVSMLTGLMVLTAGGEWIALFSPLRPWGIVIILLLLNGCAWRRAKSVFRGFTRQVRTMFTAKRPGWYYVSFAGLLLLVLIFNAGPLRMDDSGSYHIQAVKWLQTFGTVPGIANLHLRFGFNSAWFSGIGLLTFSFRGLNGYLSLNGTICCWFCFYLLNKFADSLEPAAAEREPGLAPGIFFVLLASLANWYILRRSAASTGYDFIATMSLVILILESNGKVQPPVEWLIWPLFLFTVRLTSYPLLLLPLAFCLLKRGELRYPWRKAGVAGAFFILPFIARNILLSGYPLFPVTAFGFWPADWKADPRLAETIREYIRYFNRVNPMFQSIATTRLQGSVGWIASWWQYLFTPDRITLLAGVAGYILYLFRPAAGDRLSRLLIAVMMLSLAAWFCSAPDPRFVQGIFLCGILYGARAVFRKPVPYQRAMVTAFCLAGILCAGYSVFRQRTDGTETSMLLPTALPVPAVREVRAGSIVLHIPEKILGNWNPRCYDVDLPCLYLPDPRLMPRGTRVEDGFRLDPARNQIAAPFSGEYFTK